jgi:hypothetical protein
MINFCIGCNLVSDNNEKSLDLLEYFLQHSSLCSAGETILLSLPNLLTVTFKQPNYKTASAAASAA